ncbi:MAG: OmpA family protein [Gemmatimonadaceae bacterium]|nr:OmpA family protein [Chitinophagaceae bacterium]
MSQNLLPNGGFEDANICSELSKPCAPESWVSTTLDKDMYFFSAASYAQTGAHFAAFVVHDKNNLSNRSFLRSRILCGLRKGNSYSISFFVRSAHALFDSIGIVFSDKDFLYLNNPVQQITSAAIWRDTIHKDPVDPTRWYRVKLNYTASGNETFIALGSFKKEILVNDRPDMKGLYYMFVDSVNMMPLDPSELVCPTADSVMQQSYRENERHTVMHRRISFYRRNPEVEPLPPKTLLMSTDTFLIPDILFNTGSAVLGNASLHVLDSIALKLSDTGIDSVIIAGHTDSIGKVEANEKLSDGRARTVLEYLNLKSAGKDHPMITRSYGSRRPLTSNADAVGRRRNRRVEIYIYRKKSY